MAVNVFKRTNAIAQKATTDCTVNFVSTELLLIAITAQKKIKIN